MLNEPPKSILNERSQTLKVKVSGKANTQNIVSGHYWRKERWRVATRTTVSLWGHGNVLQLTINYELTM